MKKLVAFLAAIGTAFCILFSAAAANASIEGPCAGQGVTPTNAGYGTCAVTRPARASATFSNDGSTVTLKKVESGQVASFWQSNGPIAGTPDSVCVTVSVNVTGRAGGEQRLVMSANGVSTYQTFPLSSGLQQYCFSPDTAATNVWWQLITYLGDKPSGRATVTETLIGVTAR